MPQDDELRQVLVAREAERLSATTPFDPTAAAIALLSPDEQKDFPKVVAVGADWTDKERNQAHGRWKALNTGRRPEAYTEAGKPDIFMPTWTDTYRAAQKNDPAALRMMAGMLAHERAHLQYGADEQQPYDIQLEVLRRLGADPKAIKQIEKARAAIVNKGTKR